MSKLKIGRIKTAEFGLMGYQEGEIGLFLDIAFSGSGVMAGASGFWANNNPSDRASWTKESTYQIRSEMLDKVIKGLNASRVRFVSQLAGKLVKCEFDGNTLKSWEFLEED